MDNSRDHFALHVGQAKVAAVEAIGHVLGLLWQPMD
jgi:hypothetical protein